MSRFAAANDSVAFVVRGVVIKAETNFRDSGQPQVAMHSQLPRFSVIIITLPSVMFKMVIYCFDNHSAS